jgi:hypothetical protein
MSSTGFGIDLMGDTPYGGPTFATALAIQSTLALSTRSVRVTLTDEPLHMSSVGVGDALNPSTWTIRRLDTGAYFDIMDVSEYTSTVFNLTVAQPFGSAFVNHEVTTSTLVDVSGTAMLQPTSAQFVGVIDVALSTPSERLATAGASVRDFANPQTRRVSPDLVGGTLVVNSAGDYESVTGVELFKKLVIRRLTTKKREFFHLPDYGLDLKSKDLVRAGDLAPLKTEIERQVGREPETEDVLASLILDSRGIVYATIKAKLRSGESANFTVPIIGAGVQL